MSLDELKGLNIKEKIILINTIWESLENESLDVESPSWHKEVLEDRIKKMKSGDATYISIEDLKCRSSQKKSA